MRTLSASFYREKKNSHKDIGGENAWLALNNNHSFTQISLYSPPICGDENVTLSMVTITWLSFSNRILFTVN